MPKPRRGETLIRARPGVSLALQDSPTSAVITHFAMKEGVTDANVLLSDLPLCHAPEFVEMMLDGRSTFATSVMVREEKGSPRFPGAFRGESR